MSRRQRMLSTLRRGPTVGVVMLFVLWIFNVWWSHRG